MPRSNPPRTPSSRVESAPWRPATSGCPAPSVSTSLCMTPISSNAARRRSASNSPTARRGRTSPTPASSITSYPAVPALTELLRWRWPTTPSATTPVFPALTAGRRHRALSHRARWSSQPRHSALQAAPSDRSHLVAASPSPFRSPARVSNPATARPTWSARRSIRTSAPSAAAARSTHPRRERWSSSTPMTPRRSLWAAATPPRWSLRTPVTHLSLPTS